MSPTSAGYLLHLRQRAPAPPPQLTRDRSRTIPEPHVPVQVQSGTQTVGPHGSRKVRILVRAWLTGPRCREGKRTALKQSIATFFGRSSSKKKQPGGGRACASVAYEWVSARIAHWLGPCGRLPDSEHPRRLAARIRRRWYQEARAPEPPRPQPSSCRWYRPMRRLPLPSGASASSPPPHTVPPSRHITSLVYSASQPFPRVHDEPRLLCQHLPSCVTHLRLRLRPLSLRSLPPRPVLATPIYSPQFGRGRVAARGSAGSRQDECGGE